jgi:transcriptional regulator with XRE-family HTH domain
MPHPVDVMVGKRIRLRRVQLGLSQTELGHKLGVTFQQIQKYENGTNRVSCSRLYETSVALDVPIAYFFVDSANTSIELAVAEQFDVPDLKDGIHLMTAFRQIPSGAIRKSFIAFVESLAGELGGERR